jgi:predicted phosphohydrolase
MKVFAISDLHLSLSTNKPMDVFGKTWENYLPKIKEDWLKKVTEEDIVLIAGDISWAMKLQDATKDLEWISNLPGKKVIIRGNHDYWWKSPSSIRNLLPENMYIIQNDSLKLDNYIFCGTRGWTVPERQVEQTPNDLKIYKREVARLELSIKSAIQKKQNNEHIIALIHYPPFNSTMQDNEFTALFEKYNIKTVIYGHLHGEGSRTVLKQEKNGVTYYLTSCDKLNNKLIQLN